MARTTHQHREIDLKKAKRYVLKAFNNKKPKVPMLWGPPGIGKSELVQQIADSGDLGNCLVIDIRLPLMEPTDIRGIPYFNPTENTMKWAPSEEFPNEELASQYDHVILFLDELSAAPQSVQAASYQLMLNRRVGTYVLPKNVRVIAAGNGETDGSVSFKMPKALQNRLMHFQLRVDVDGWMDWALMNDVHSDVIGYIGFAKGDLFDFDPRSPERSFATPRSWTFFSDVLHDTDDMTDADIMELAASTVGEGKANSFMAQRKHAKDLPNPADVLSGKVKELKTKEISAMYTLAVNLCRELDIMSDKYGEKDSKKFHGMADNFFRFIMDNMGADMVILASRTALHQYDLVIEPTELKTFDEFTERFGKSVAKAIKMG